MVESEYESKYENASDHLDASVHIDASINLEASFHPDSYILSIHTLVHYFI